jgi:predicted AAA+ superfamily ATPase
MIPRKAEHILKKMQKEYPAIAITGPRQSGKTTLAKYVFKDKPYVSLEDLDILYRAKNDPRGFLQRYNEGAVFDEAQRCPELFSYLQGIIDKNNKPGQFILTGSSQFGLLSKITQSLAGRIGIVELLPFSYSELYQNTADATIDEVLFTGLYPPIHDKKLDSQLWHINYLRTYIERDARQLINVKNLNSFHRFVRLCAGRIGQLLNLSGLATDCSISHNTARDWISILEASYIIFLLQPHHKNFNKRLIKTPKLYFYDTGLVSCLLSIQTVEQLNIHPFRGSMFESFIISELIKSRFNIGLPGNLYFWRDRSGSEIDIIIEKSLSLQPIEIKSGQTVNSSFFKGLTKWLNLAGPIAKESSVIYGGKDSFTHSGISVYGWKEFVLHIP